MMRRHRYHAERVAGCLSGLLDEALGRLQAPIIAPPAGVEPHQAVRDAALELGLSPADAVQVTAALDDVIHGRAPSAVSETVLAWTAHRDVHGDWAHRAICCVAQALRNPARLSRSAA